MERAIFVSARGESALQPLDAGLLPAGDLLVRVEWSSLNYKDALAITGRSPIIRGEYPFIPGIDLAGTVLESDDPAFRPGDRVLQTGWGLGETRWGGFSTLQRVRSQEVVRLPDLLTTRQAMIAGTAGLTAALAVGALRRHGVRPGGDPVLVTGASGGVGSFSVLLLSRAGFRVEAVTGSAASAGYLRDLGAETVISRAEFAEGTRRPMENARWAGAVDVVAGSMLPAILSRVGRHGCVAACGLAGGPELVTTIFPFILRGVVLAGVDSNTSPGPERAGAWGNLAARVAAADWDRIGSTIQLAEVPESSVRLLDEGVHGRLVVNCQDAR